MHGATVSCIWPHERAALAKGVPKTKHIIAKKVTLTNIELAMVGLENLDGNAVQVFEWVSVEEMIVLWWIAKDYL